MEYTNTKINFNASHLKFFILQPVSTITKNTYHVVIKQYIKNKNKVKYVGLININKKHNQ